MANDQEKIHQLAGWIVRWAKGEIDLLLMVYCGNELLEIRDIKDGLPTEEYCWKCQTIHKSDELLYDFNIIEGR